MATGIATRLQEKGIEWDPEDRHWKCFAHILNLGAKEITSEIKHNVEKVCYN
jgi:hypothetical protein